MKNKSVLYLVVICVTLVGVDRLRAFPRPPGLPLPELSPVLYRQNFNQPYDAGNSNAEVSVKGVGVLRESWSGYSLQRLGVVTPFVISSLNETGRVQVAADNASVRLWLMPYWSSASTGEGKGPGSSARLLEFVAVDGNQPAVLWSLRTSDDGSLIYLNGAGQDGEQVLLKAEIGWRAGEWHQVVLTYGSKGTELVLDGEKVADGTGTVVVSPNVSGLVVGSSLAGEESFGGEMDELFCFSKPLKMAFHYTAFKDQAALGPVTEAELQARAEKLAKRKAEYEARKALEGEGGGGGMMLRMSGPSVSCVTNGPVYLTNVLVTLTTNDGWTVYFDIAGGTNGIDYDIFSTPQLAGNDVTNSVWTWLETGQTCETHYFTNQPTNQMFYVLTIPGADRDNDGMYDGWEWKHFGTLAQTAGGDYDGDGISNENEYLNGSDPNSLWFSISLTNRFIKNAVENFPLTITEGVPFRMSVLMDNTNFAGATRLPYTPSPPVSIGTNEGWHQVWIGLRGRADASEPVWQRARVKYDVTPPVLVVTNPTVMSVARPAIQFQGFSREELVNVTYDVIRTSTQDTNQSGFVLAQHYDTNDMAFSTNYFQCFDVELENGTNSITIRATDLAGNIGTTNVQVVLDYSSKTNPPVIALGWPQNATLIGASNFTCRGWADDPTVKVVAQSIGPSGVTNTAYGRVSRNGDFWIENIPAQVGTNSMILTVTDAAGNSSVTNIYFVRSSVTFTVDQTSWTDASGTISDPAATVTVNGVSAVNDGYGNWNVSGLQANLDSSSLSAQASSGGGQSIEMRKEIERPAGAVYMNSYHAKYDKYITSSWTNHSAIHFTSDWEELLGGKDAYYDVNSWLAFYSGGRWPQFGNGYWFWLPNGATNNLYPPYGVPPGVWEQTDYGHYGEWEGGDSVSIKETAQAELTLITGGKAGETGKTLFRIAADAYDDTYQNSHEVPPEMITVKNVGQINANGSRYRAMPNGLQMAATPAVNSGDIVYLGLSAAPYKPHIYIDGQDITDSVTNVVVGQKINLTCYFPGSLPSDFPAITNWEWTIPGYAISNYVADVNSGTVYPNFSTTKSNTSFYWVSGGSKEVKCTLKLGGQEITAKTTIKVTRPLPTFNAEIRDQVRVDTNNWYYTDNRQPHPAGIYLHFGISSSSANDGIAFVYTNAPIDSSSHTYGRYFIAQVMNSLIQRYNLYTNGVCEAGYQTNDVNALDGGYPAPGNFSEATQSPGDWADSPGAELTSAHWLYQSNSFSTYLMFRPKPYDATTIDVPMYKVVWSWSGSATNNPWGKRSGSAACGTAYVAEEFPIWTHIKQGVDTSPEFMLRTNCFDEN
ncbi:MAG: hypothetical protein HOP33_09885 [Verrucomicrobia bacterium]|nr:hypothetical protein [Verrucomicrobiota bacterium]